MSQFNIAFDGESLITPQSIITELSSSKTDRHDEQLATAKAELALVLAIAMQQIEEARDPAQTVKRLIGALHETRNKFEPSVRR